MFHSELPLRIDRSLSTADDEKLNGLIETHFSDCQISRSKLREELCTIAATLRHSRALRSQKASRSDARATLRAVADTAEGLSRSLAELPLAAVAFIESRYDCSMFEEPRFGSLIANRVSIQVQEISDCAVIAQRIDNPVSIKMWDRIRSQAKDLADKLALLPMATSWSLTLIEQYVARPRLIESNSPAVSTLRSLLDHLVLLARVAAEAERSERGPEPDTAQQLTVQSLARLYCEATGISVTHTAHQSKNYIGEARSEFGSFVTDFMKIAGIDPIDRRGLNEAIAAVAWPSRGLARQNTVKEQRLQRERRIIAALENSRPVTNNSRPH